MSNDYLPPYATIEQACEYVANKVGGAWILSRLLEHGLTPWFWLAHDPRNEGLFEGRYEGFLAPLIFAGDARRLLADGAALATISRTPDGRTFKVVPGIPVPLREIRFLREDIDSLVASLAQIDAPVQTSQEADQELLKRFRDQYGGDVSKDGKMTGERGALARLARDMERDDSTVRERLRRAARRERDQSSSPFSPSRMKGFHR